MNKDWLKKAADAEDEARSVSVGGLMVDFSNLAEALFELGAIDQKTLDETRERFALMTGQKDPE
jgi:hypothetical protein